MSICYWNLSDITTWRLGDAGFLQSCLQCCGQLSPLSWHCLVSPKIKTENSSLPSWHAECKTEESQVCTHCIHYSLLSLSPSSLLMFPACQQLDLLSVHKSAGKAPKIHEICQQQVVTWSFFNSTNFIRWPARFIYNPKSDLVCFFILLAPWCFCVSSQTTFQWILQEAGYILSDPTRLKLSDCDYVGTIKNILSLFNPLTWKRDNYVCKFRFHKSLSSKTLILDLKWIAFTCILAALTSSSWWQSARHWRETGNSSCGWKPSRCWALQCRRPAHRASSATSMMTPEETAARSQELSVQG